MNEEQVNSVKYSVESILMSSEFTNIEKDMIPAIPKKDGRKVELSIPEIRMSKRYTTKSTMQIMLNGVIEQETVAEFGADLC